MRRSPRETTAGPPGRSQRIHAHGLARLGLAALTWACAPDPLAKAPPDERVGAEPASNSAPEPAGGPANAPGGPKTSVTASGTADDPATGVEAPDPPSTPPDLPPPPDPDGDERGEVAPGGSLAAVLRDAGLDAQDRLALLEALSAHADPARVRVGQPYVISRAAGQLVAFTLERSRTESVRVQRAVGGEIQDGSDSGKAWTAKKVELETRRELSTYRGELRGSLWKSLERAGADPALVAIFVDAFAYDIDFHTDARAGDHFALVVEREMLGDEFIRYGRVHAAVYDGAVGRLELFWWPREGGEDPSEGAYYDGDGRGIKRTFLKSPLKFSRVSSEFSPKRMHPVLHREKGHMGTDYAAPEGTPVWAAADGKIVVRSERGGAGNMVILRHANGLKTLYMHLSRFEDGQSVGDRVQQKQIIGYVGMTGLATGPHLHFGVQRSGRYVDPASVEVHREADLPRKQRKRFLRQVEHLREQLEGPKAPATPVESGAAGSDATQHRPAEDAGANPSASVTRPKLP